MKQRSPTERPAHRRHGFTVFELAVAVFLLAVAMTVTVQLLGSIAAERRAVGRRELASREVANLMERLSARPWSRLSDGAVNDVRPSEAIRDALPGAELAVSVDAASANPDLPCKRVSVRLRWRNRAGEFDAPVRLTTWVYGPAEGRTAR